MVSRQLSHTHPPFSCQQNCVMFLSRVLHRDVWWPDFHVALVTYGHCTVAAMGWWDPIQHVDPNKVALREHRKSRRSRGVRQSHCIITTTSCKRLLFVCAQIKSFANGVPGFPTVKKLWQQFAPQRRPAADAPRWRYQDVKRVIMCYLRGTSAVVKLNLFFLFAAICLHFRAFAGFFGWSKACRSPSLERSTQPIKPILKSHRRTKNNRTPLGIVGICLVLKRKISKSGREPQRSRYGRTGFV